MAFRKSIYFKISVPLALAPIFALLAILFVEQFGTQNVGEWSSKLTFLCAAISAPIYLAISKFRDLCCMDGLTAHQRTNLVQIIRRRTLRFWIALLYVVAVFLFGFLVNASASTEFSYLVTVAWIFGFLFTLYILVISHFWIDEAEDFKLKVSEQLRDEKERAELIQALRKSETEKVEAKPDLERYNKIYDSRTGTVQ